MFKKIFLYPVLLCLVFLTTCTKKCSCPEPPCLLASLNNGLIAYFPFNGNANDESGYGNNVVFNNATLTTDRNNQPNKAYSFNGVDTYMKVLNSSYLNPERISLCAIVKVKGFYKGKCHGNVILYKGLRDEDIYNVYFLRFDDTKATNQNSCALTTVDSTHENFAGSFAGNIPTPSGVPVVEKEKWYYVVYTSDGTTAKLYVDGTLVGTSPVTNAYQVSSTDLYIGKTINPTYPYWFNGVMDEIRIYNRALSAEEVKSWSSSCNNQ